MTLRRRCALSRNRMKISAPQVLRVGKKARLGHSVVNVENGTSPVVEGGGGGRGNKFQPELPTDFHFKTVISVEDGSQEKENLPRQNLTNAQLSSQLISTPEVERPIRYSVVLNIGDEDGIESREIRSREESLSSNTTTYSDASCIRIPVSMPAAEAVWKRPLKDDSVHFLPPPASAAAVSSLYIRPPPPPVPKRGPRKGNSSARGKFLATMLPGPSSSPRSLARKESQNSGCSSSSSSGLSSSGSPTSSVVSLASKKDTRHPPPSPRDSDYFGSSSEDEDEVERFADGGKTTPASVGIQQAMLGEAQAEGEAADEEDPNDRLAPLQPNIGFPGLRRMRRFTLPHTSKEYDLEQRIALEIKMREGTTKLLAACGAKSPQANQPHTLEAAKSLLTSNERMTAYMAELQRRRTSKRTNTEGCEPSLARVCVSDLRMPLLWKDIEHFKNKGDNRKFAVFVLLKIGTEIYDTVMVNPVDRSMTDICFDDILVFNGIPSNFECSVEVYSHLFESEMLMASIPRKLKKTFHSSISRTVGRKLAVTLRDELASGDPGPKFEMVASAKLTAEHISSNISTFDLYCDEENKPDQLPLLGHFCCRIAAQPNCFTQERISGPAKVPESGLATPSWCRVFGWRLEVWETKEEAETSPHHPLALSLDRTTEVNQTSMSALQLVNSQGVDRGRLTLSFKTSDECSKWFKLLQQHISDHRHWGKAAEEEMEILTPQPSRHSFMVPKRGRFTSLYEETPLRDGSPSSEKSSTDDLYNQVSYTNPYSTPSQYLPPRTRAFTLSSSTRSSFRRWGSVRANMPFFKTKS